MGGPAAASRSACGSTNVLIRVSAPADFPTRFLAEAIGSVRARHPRVTFEVILSNALLELVSDNIDIVLRMGSEFPRRRHAHGFRGRKRPVREPRLPSTAWGADNARGRADADRAAARHAQLPRASRLLPRISGRAGHRRPLGDVCAGMIAPSPTARRVITPLTLARLCLSCTIAGSVEGYTPGDSGR